MAADSASAQSALAYVDGVFPTLPFEQLSVFECPQRSAAALRTVLLALVHATL
jgi:hypothetical protein